MSKKTEPTVPTVAKQGLVGKANNATGTHILLNGSSLAAQDVLKAKHLPMYDAPLPTMLYADIDFGPAIGTGRSATVYRGRLRTTGHLVAIKMFNFETSVPQSLMALHHDNVVRTFGVSEDPLTRHAVLLKELAEGTLADTIHDPTTPWGAVVAQCLQVAVGLT